MTVRACSGMAVTGNGALAVDKAVDDDDQPGVPGLSEARLAVRLAPAPMEPERPRVPYAPGRRQYGESFLAMPDSLPVKRRG